MAAELDLEKETASHRKGYAGFLGLMKWGAVVSAVIAFIVVIIISA